MKTAYYTFITWTGDAMAAGFGSEVSGPRQAALVRQPEQRPHVSDESKVIDLTAWRAANADLPEEEPLDEPEPAVPAPRARRSHQTMFTAELVSTLSVVAAALALIVRVLTF